MVSFVVGHIILNPVIGEFLEVIAGPNQIFSLDYCLQLYLNTWLSISYFISVIFVRTMTV